MTADATHHIRVEFNHTADGAAVVKHYALDNTTLRKARIWQAAQNQRPSAQQLDQWLYDNGDLLDRADGPAYVATFNDGTRTEQWYCNGKLDRAGGPAYLETLKDGTRIEQWWSNGQLDRADGPAWIETYNDGSTRYEAWWTKGKFIKSETLDNPATIPCVTPDPPHP